MLDSPIAKFAIFAFCLLAFMSAVIFYSAPKNKGKISGIGDHDSDGYRTAFVLVNYSDGPDQTLAMEMSIASMGGNVDPTRSVCIDGFELRSERVGSNPPGSGGGNHYSFGEAIYCIDQDGSGALYAGVNRFTGTIDAAIQDPPFLYPYNNTEFRITLAFFGYFKDNKEERVRIPMAVRWDLRAPGKDLRVVSVGQEQQDYSGPTGIANYLQIDMNTPFVFRALTPLLALLIFFFICFLPFIESSGEFAQAALGLVLGLWATREILVPADLRGTVLLDSIFVAAYASLAISVAFWLFMNYRSRSIGRAAQEPKQKADPKRKR